MKKISFLCCFVFALAMTIPGWSYAHMNDPWTTSSVQMLDDDDDDDAYECTRDVNLTAEQKARLDKLFDRLQQDHKELIDLYADYGAVSKEQKDKKLRELNRYIESVKKDHKWCVEFDDDEIEYEHHHKHPKHHKHIRDDRNERE